MLSTRIHTRLLCPSVTKSKKKKMEFEKKWMSVCQSQNPKKKGIPFQPVHYFSSNKNFTFLHSMKITSLLLVMSIYLSVTKSKKKNGIPKKCEVNWIELNWIEVNWSEVKWIKVKWSEVKWSELKWGEVNPVELNWIELNWIELNWIELNWIEAKSSEVKWSEWRREEEREAWHTC